MKIQTLTLAKLQFKQGHFEKALEILDALDNTSETVILREQINNALFIQNLSSYTEEIKKRALFLNKALTKIKESKNDRVLKERELSFNDLYLECDISINKKYESSKKLQQIYSLLEQCKRFEPKRREKTLSFDDISLDLSAEISWGYIFEHSDNEKASLNSFETVLEESKPKEVFVSAKPLLEQLLGNISQKRERKIKEKESFDDISIDLTVDISKLFEVSREDLKKERVSNTDSVIDSSERDKFFEEKVSVEKNDVFEKQPIEDELHNKIMFLSKLADSFSTKKNQKLKDRYSASFDDISLDCSIDISNVFKVDKKSVNSIKNNLIIKENLFFEKQTTDFIEDDTTFEEKIVNFAEESVIFERQSINSIEDDSNFEKQVIDSIEIIDNEFNDDTQSTSKIDELHNLISFIQENKKKERKHQDNCFDGISMSVELEISKEYSTPIISVKKSRLDKKIEVLNSLLEKIDSYKHQKGTK
ncbi:hypothetical protein JXR93_03500 [bacterium]|nr:hypothetical protein [bacterium]